MSTTTTGDDLNLRDQLARIDSAIAETHKLQAESDKFVAEQRRLLAEAAKLTWDRRFSPWLLLASLSGGAIVAAVNHFWK